MGNTLLVETFLNNGVLHNGLFVGLQQLSGAVEGLPVLLADSAIAGFLGKLGNWGQVALGLGFVIFIHELGHFLAAKTFGVRCDKFYIGFDVPISIGPIHFPRTLGKFQWGETEYGIGIIPLGGYVKMLGQDDDPRQAEIEAEKIRLGEGEDAPLDPRSYPAKPVWQRMIIISAGVVMNLISAVILAGVAYWYGVPYQPTIAGALNAGGPAWIAGIESGDQIVRFGDMKYEDPHLRYSDLRTGIAVGGFENGAKPMTISVLRNGKPVDIEATPTPMYSPDKDVYLIGMTSQSIPVVGPTPYPPASFLGKKEPDLQAGDKIVAVNGDPLPVNEQLGEVLGSDFIAQLQAHWREPVQLTIERKPADQKESGKTVEVTLPAVPVKSLGIGFQIGPVTAIRKGSAAEASGFQPGDIIEQINGETIADSLRLPSRFAELAGQEVAVKIRRPAAGKEDNTAESLELKLTSPAIPVFDTVAMGAGQLTLGGTGVAFDVLPIVSYVDSESKANAQVQVGDHFKQYQWIVGSEERKGLAEQFTKYAFEPHKIDGFYNVASFQDLIQSIPEGSTIACDFERDGKIVEAELAVEYTTDWYRGDDRGLALMPLQQIHQTTNFADAMKLGLWETKRRFTEVLNFLRLLVTGKIGAKGFGGPLTIAEVASSEASAGVSRLLLFLTLLSANLAILNFLPIPALDGGHMVFLTAEAIRGKPVNEALQIRLTMVGVLGLLSLMAFVIIKDILRYV